MKRSDLLWACESRSGCSKTTAEDYQLRERVVAAVDTKKCAAAPRRDGPRWDCIPKGFIMDDRFRQTVIVGTENVPGGKLVHDHLYPFDAMSRLSFRSPEDQEGAKAI